MRADEVIATRQVTPAMIGAAHDVTMKEAGIILSHDLITKIYEAMQAQAAKDRRVSYACQVCAASLEAREQPR
ncbi:hypothetical protein [Schlegelella aquatica]|uniref:hypothetical protein n=1 Tax=Caldimonas aquatica TaxID=376175 RepID=UPI003753180B